MRILFISCDFPNPFETTKAVFNLALVKALSRIHDVEVVSPISWIDEWRSMRRGCSRLPDTRIASVEGVSVHYPRYYYPPKLMRHWYGWFYWRSVRETVYRILNQERIDAVIAYWVHPDGEAAVRAGKIGGIPAGVIVGGSDVLLVTRDTIRSRCVSNVLKSADVVVTVNRHLKEKVMQLGVGGDKVHVWSQGVDNKVFFAGDRDDARRLLGIPLDLKVVLWVGRLVPVKGLEVLFKACSLLKNRIDFRVYIVGDGPLCDELKADVKVRSLEGAIHFVGSRPPSELGDWYRAADLTVLSSWSEGLPNVLRESLACGTPFVASCVGGIPEIAGSTNILFPPGDAVALADAIYRSLKESAIYAGKSISQSSPVFSWEESAAALVNILRPLAESRRIGRVATDTRANVST